MRLLCTVALVLSARAASAEVGPGDLRRVEWTHEASAPFTPTRTSSGTPLRWAGSCVFLRPHVTGPADVPADDFAAALAGATSSWESATSACSYLHFQLEPPEAGEVGLDYVNRIIVREDRWCRPGPPEHCYDAGATAITTVFFVDKPGDPADGTILDADIELNAVDYALATCSDPPGGCTTTGTGVVEDLANTLTHELGHVVGLDHTCWSGAPQDAPLDGDGVPVPSCTPPSSLPASVTEATMYPFEDPEETKKRTPEADDVDGFCRTYPSASDPGVCAPVTPPVAGDGNGDGDAGLPPTEAPGGCCRTSGGDGGFVLVLLVAVIARRRSR